MNIDDLLSFLHEYIEDEHLRGVPNRALLLINELGSIAKIWTHDSKNNPMARSVDYLNSAKEVEYGDAFMMLLTMGIEDGIDWRDVITVATERLRNKEWQDKTAEKKVEPTSKKWGEIFVTGKTAYNGEIVGPARVVHSVEAISEAKSGEILVTPMLPPDISTRIANLAGIVTDCGGITSHAAIIAREFGIPCVVGTGDATKQFKTGDILEVIAGPVGTVVLVPTKRIQTSGGTARVSL